MIKVSKYQFLDMPYVRVANRFDSSVIGVTPTTRHRVFYIANPALKGRNKSGGGYKGLVKTNKSMQRAKTHDMVGNTL